MYNCICYVWSKTWVWLKTNFLKWAWTELSLGGSDSCDHITGMYARRPLGIQACILHINMSFIQNVSIYKTLDLKTTKEPCCPMSTMNKPSNWKIQWGWNRITWTKLWRRICKNQNRVSYERRPMDRTAWCHITDTSAFSEVCHQKEKHLTKLLCSGSFSQFFHLFL